MLQEVFATLVVPASGLVAWIDALFRALLRRPEVSFRSLRETWIPGRSVLQPAALHKP